jgi:hypothetical protein
MARYAHSRVWPLLIDLVERQHALNGLELNGTGFMRRLRPRAIGLAHVQPEIPSILSDEQHCVNTAHQLVTVELGAAVVARRRRLAAPESNAAAGSHRTRDRALARIPRRQQPRTGNGVERLRGPWPALALAHVGCGEAAPSMKTGTSVGSNSIKLILRLTLFNHGAI